MSSRHPSHQAEAGPEAGTGAPASAVQRHAIEVDSLFSIDFPAERRKVLGAALADASDILSELALAARSRGATHLWLSGAKSTFTVKDDGARIPAAVVRQLGTLSNEAADPRLRHAALAELEEPCARGCLALAWHAREGALTVSTADAASSDRLEVRPGAPLVERTLAPPYERGTQIEIDLSGQAASAALARLVERARHSPLHIEVNGERLLRDTLPWLLRTELHEPLQATAGLGHEALTRVSILEYGILSAQLGLSGAPDLELVVEVGGRCGPRAGAGDLRQFVQAQATALVSAAVIEFVKRSSQPRALSLRQCSRIARLLAQAQRSDQRLTALRDVALIPLRRGDSTEYISLRELESLVDATPGRQFDVIDAADLGARDQGSTAADLRAVVLETGDRAAVAASVQASFVLLRDSKRRPGTWRGAWAKSLREWLASPASWLSAWGAAHVAESALHRDERALLEALRAECDGQVVISIIHGSRQPFRVGTRLYLSRDFPLMEQCVRAHAAGTLPVYVALRALGSQHLSAPARKRARDRFADALSAGIE